MTKLKLNGKLKYDPYRKGLKEKWWAVLQLERSNDIAAYYRNFAMKHPYKFTNPETKEKFTYLDLAPWSWETHISIAKGKKPQNERYWKKYDGEIVEVEYDTRIKIFRYPDDIDHVFYLDVYSDRLQEIKNELYGKKVNLWKFHITIGRTHYSRKL